MKFLFDFLPLLAFFGAFKVAGIFAATKVLMVASLVQIVAYYLIYKRWEKLYLITFAVVLVFGTATLLLQDERFIMWKPSVVFWLFAGATLVLPYVAPNRFPGGLFQTMLQSADKRITAPDSVWTRLNVGLAVFFVLLGLLNIYVAYYFERETWVNFKVFGITILNVLFLAAAVLYLFRYATLPKESGSQTTNQVADQAIGDK